MKKAFFVIAVLILSLSASAFEFSAPDTIPDKVNWSIYADFGSMDFDKIQVLLDGDVVYEKGLGEETDYSKVVSTNYHAPGKKLTASFVGLDEGAHTVEVKIFEAGSLRDSESKQVKVFVPGSVAIANEINDEMRNLRDSFDRLSGEISEKIAALETLGTDIERLEATISSEGESVSSLQKSLEIIKKDFKALSQHFSSVSGGLEEKDKNIDAYLAGMDTSIGQIESQLEEMTTPPETAVAGFVSFVQGNPMLAVVLLLVVVALIIILLVRKRREKGMLFETGELESEVHEAEAPSPEEADTGEDSDSTGKWAFGRGAAESKKFRVGDLLWRKK